MVSRTAGTPLRPAAGQGDGLTHRTRFQRLREERPLVHDGSSRRATFSHLQTLVSCLVITVVHPTSIAHLHTLQSFGHRLAIETSHPHHIDSYHVSTCFVTRDLHWLFRWSGPFPTHDQDLWIRTSVPKTNFWPCERGPLRPKTSVNPKGSVKQCVGKKGRFRTFWWSIVDHIVPKTETVF